jgi:hypothetical protein
VSLQVSRVHQFRMQNRRQGSFVADDRPAESEQSTLKVIPEGPGCTKY